MGEARGWPDVDYSLHYRNWHNESPEHVRQMVGQHLDLFRRWLPGPHSGSALDIGCGMGFAVLALRELGYIDAQGIDTDAAQVNTARRLKANVDLVSDSAAYLAERAGRYTVISLLDVLEHVPVHHQVDLLRQIHAALVPGGRLLLQVPNASHPLAARWRYIDYTHHTSFTEHSLRFVLLNAGFRDITIQGYEPLRRPSLRIWRPGSRRLWWRWALLTAWRSLMETELVPHELSHIPLTLNMVGVATRSAAGAS